MPRQQQASLPIANVRNRGLFSNHWFENRLPLEPEYHALLESARAALESLRTLWDTQRNRVERYGAEQPLEYAFIQPVFEALGWRLFYQTFLQGRKPDYALFLSDAALETAIHVGRNDERFWQFPTVVADAKAWDVPLNRRSIINNEREYPPQQIEWYLDRSRLDFGILTNGHLWRLVPRELQSQQRRFQTYLECDLAKLLDDWRAARSITERDSVESEFLEFFLFFGPAGYLATDTRRSLLDRAIKGSSDYRIGVGEGLKERAFEALRLCIVGFLEHAPNGLSSESDLEICRSESFILLYRLLFIMYAEDRRLLPYGRNRLYTTNRSLRRHRDDVATRQDRVRDGTEADFSHDSTAIWEDLQSLFDLINSGHRTYGVPEYNGGLFSDEAHPFLTEKRIDDYYLARVIDQLGRATDPLHPNAGLFRVDYRDLAIQHLGGIYEGLLELKPDVAKQNIVVITRREQGQAVEAYHPESKPLPQGWQLTDRRLRRGSVFLRTEKGERRASGSYYTPDHIVNAIVEKTLRPVCDGVNNELSREIAGEELTARQARGPEKAASQQRLDRLRAEFDDRILRLRVLDPAMGSGHFLIRACQVLAEEIATNPFSADPVAEGESSVAYWKRRVVENCLFGVDLNDLAVELAKLALWLETVADDEPLSFLDHHLHHGNSLVGGTLDRLAVLPGFPLLSDKFKQQLQTRLPAFLEPLAQISAMRSDTAEHVRQKERHYRDFERAREPFRQVADLWCSVFCPDTDVTPERYQQVLDQLGRPRRFEALAREAWFQRALARVRQHFRRCCHWELEFPQAYFEGTERQVNPGFDAVIGNPPYEVLSELESGHDLTAFKEFIQSEALYAPTRRGKNNLYKLFVCRALGLLRDGGHLGFITPMAILGDDQSADVRRGIVDVASFTGIEAFPQKDDPSRRVFEQAKLSTAVVTVRKGRPGTSEPTFIARVHPANKIEIDSPSLRLSTSSIPLYDPVNFTIVSCSQADWDLATRLMRTGRMVRLAEYCVSFQGEVNETTETRQGAVSANRSDGPLILRGSNVCLYAVRQASQGEARFLCVDEFFDGKSPTAKAFHSREERIGFQRSSPQNNFRRIVAAPLAAGSYCFDTISYVPKSTTKIPLNVILALLNSKLLDWYFRLGSTNSKVNEYQFNNLPCPVFGANNGQHVPVVKKVRAELQMGRVHAAEQLLVPFLETPPFAECIISSISAAVERICAIEHERGEIARTARSALDPAAQPYQDFIDRLFYTLAGLTPDESAALEHRLATML